MILFPLPARPRFARWRPRTGLPLAEAPAPAALSLRQLLAVVTDPFVRAQWLGPAADQAPPANAAAFFPPQHAWSWLACLQGRFIEHIGRTLRVAICAFLDRFIARCRWSALDRIRRDLRWLH